MEQMLVRVQREENQPLGIAFRKLDTPPYCQVALLQDKGAAKLSQQVRAKRLYVQYMACL